MSHQKLKNLPQNDAIRLAIECEMEGRKAANGFLFDTAAVHFLGLCQIVFDLRAKVQELENKNQTHA